MIVFVGVAAQQPVASPSPAAGNDDLILIISLAAAGLLLLLLLLLCLLLLLARRRRRQKPKPVNQETLDSSTTTTSTPPTSDDSLNDDGVAPPPIFGQTSHTGRRAPDDLVGYANSPDIMMHPLAARSASAWNTGNAQAPRRTPHSDDIEHRWSADPVPGLGAERPRPAPPPVNYFLGPPKPAREARGWAPASHAVPSGVKRTWGRVKAKLVTQQPNPFSDQ